MKFFVISAALLGFASASPVELQSTPTVCEQPDPTPYPMSNTTVCPCWGWYKVQKGDDCEPVAQKNGITKQQLLEWNPRLSTTIEGTFYECMGMWPSVNLCVSTTAPSPLPLPPCNKNPPYPVGKGTVCGCKKWYKVERGDDCGPVASKFGISKEQLLEWNPWLSMTIEGTFYECMGMWPSSNLCVAT